MAGSTDGSAGNSLDCACWTCQHTLHDCPLQHRFQHVFTFCNYYHPIGGKPVTSEVFR